MKQTLGRQVVSTVPVKHILLLQCGPQAGPGGRRPAGRCRPGGSRGLRARAGPCTLGYTNVVAVALAKTAAIYVNALSPPSAYQISLKSDDFRLRYSDKTIFKMAAVRHLEVSKFGIVVMYPVLERDPALSYKISR